MFGTDARCLEKLVLLLDIQIAGYDKVGQTEFTVYCHKDFDFARGQAVIFHISNQ